MECKRRGCNLRRCKSINKKNLAELPDIYLLNKMGLVWYTAEKIVEGIILSRDDALILCQANSF